MSSRATSMATLPPADHGDFLSFKRPFASAGRITVVPFHELGCAVYAVQIGARQSERLVFDCTGGEQHGIVTFEQFVERHVLAEFHVAVQVDVRVVERLLERGCDEFDGRVVGGHAVAHQPNGTGSFSNRSMRALVPSPSSSPSLPSWRRKISEE